MKIVGAHVIFHRFLAGRDGHILAVLLHKRTQDAPTYPGYWGLFGGGMDDSDRGDPLEAVKREVAEELESGDVDVEGITELCRVPIAGGGEDELIQYYRAPLDKDMDKLRLKKTSNKVEGEGIGWFTAAEVQQLRIRPEDRAALEEFFEAGV